VNDLPPREGWLIDLPPREGWLIDLSAGPPWVRGPLKILRSLLGTPVEIKPLLFVTPMPAKVRPLNLATGSTRKTRLTLTSLKWFETNPQRL